MIDGIVAVLRKDGRFLVIQRGAEVPFGGYWAPLTGKLQRGESAEDALVREVLEEVGLDVRPLREVWACVSQDGDYRLHWWTAEIVGGELRLDPREVADARWVTRAEYRALTPTFDSDRQFFDDILPTL